MKVVKPLIGGVLILVAIGGLIYWETIGRETVVTEKILVAAVDITEGEIADSAMFVEASILKENIINEALKLEDAQELIGRRASTDILKNQQIVMHAFKEKDYSMQAGKAPFKIEADWIAGRSSSLRQGDNVKLYDWRGELYLGEFEVAFVKDSGEHEVVDAVNPWSSKKILERTSGTASISHIEIIAILEEYKVIRSYIEAVPGNQILIVQKGVE